MSTMVEEVRAMLALFGKSPYRDLYVRSGGWEMFLAKPGGGANVMRTGEITAPVDTGVTIDAPHLGLFFARVAAGDAIAEGAVLGQLEVLGEREDVVAERDGKVAAVLATDGALVEYGMPLVRLAA